MKVKIRLWQGVSTWHWQLHGENELRDQTQEADELCGICRVAFDGTCPNCLIPGDKCPVVLGQGCQHNFHLHCIHKWLEQKASKGLCPMCRQIFTYIRQLYQEGNSAYSELQSLINDHQLIRSTAHNVSAEYEVFDGE